MKASAAEQRRTAQAFLDALDKEKGIEDEWQMVYDRITQAEVISTDERYKGRVTSTVLKDLKYWVRVSVASRATMLASLGGLVTDMALFHSPVMTVTLLGTTAVAGMSTFVANAMEDSLRDEVDERARVAGPLRAEDQELRKGLWDDLLQAHTERDRALNDYREAGDLPRFETVLHAKLDASRFLNEQEELLLIQKSNDLADRLNFDREKFLDLNMGPELD